MKKRLLFVVTIVVTLACIAPSTLAALPEPTPTPAPTVTTTPEQTFTVTAWTVYIRSISGERIGYKVRGDTVACELAGEWCVLSDDTRVWAGCLEPNPQGLGCSKE